jgi:hypothetical protein
MWESDVRRAAWMKDGLTPEQYPFVGIYHRVVIPIALFLIGLVLIIGSIENLSNPDVIRRGLWITLTVVGSFLLVASAGLFVFASIRHRRRQPEPRELGTVEN